MTTSASSSWALGRSYLRGWTASHRHRSARQSRRKHDHRRTMDRTLHPPACRFAQSTAAGVGGGCTPPLAGACGKAGSMIAPVYFTVRLPDGKEYAVASIRFNKDGSVRKIETFGIPGERFSMPYTLFGEELDKVTLITYTRANDGQ